jgi:hypothetical protein
MGRPSTQPAVELLNLQVIVAPEAGMWVAQAVEIDYAAAGESLEDVKERFEDGLAATIHEHLLMFGHLDSLLASAPAKQWHDLWKQKGKRLTSFSQTTVHELVARSERDDVARFFPFDRIAYFTAAVS